MPKAVIALVSLAFIAGMATPGYAAPCKDAKGKFIKCPPAPAKPQRCVDAKKRFAKCGTPGARPVS